MSSSYSLAFSLVPVAFADGLPQSTPPPRTRSRRLSCRACGTAPSSDLSPDFGHPFTFWAYRCAFAPRSLHARHPMRPHGVTTCSSAPCRPHTPWFERWMDNAFVAVVPTRPCPLFGRPVHLRGSPHRFRPGASPQALRIPPRDGHPALLDLHQGQRGITPRLWIWCSPSEHQWDFNPPEHIAAQRTL